MKNKSFGILKPQKEDYCFAYLLCIISVLSLWIGCGIAIQKSQYIAIEALRVCVDALAFRYALGADVVLANLIFYLGMALAIFILVMAIIKKDHKKYLAFAGTLFTAVAVAVACAFFAAYIWVYSFYGSIILVLILATIGLNCYNICDAMLPNFASNKQEEVKGIKVAEPEEVEEEVEEVKKPVVKRKSTAKKTTANKVGRPAKKEETTNLKKGKKTYVKKMFSKKFKDLTPEEKNEYYRVAKRRQKARKKAAKK